MNKLAIIQARMSASRLPGKVLLDIAGEPMLQRVIEHATRAKLVDQVVVATTTDPSDDSIENFCQNQNLPCYRGSQSDVLDRFYRAATQFNASIIIRLTADCPLLDPDLIDLTVQAFLGSPLPHYPAEIATITEPGSTSAFPLDFCANRLPPPWRRTIPIGLDVEVCSIGALEKAWRQADQLYQREHVMPYFYEGVSFPKVNLPVKSEWYIQKAAAPRSFKLAVLNHFPDYGSLRWTVDTAADLEFVRRVYALLGEQESIYWKQVLALLERQPDLALINSDVKPKSAYDFDTRTPHD